MSAKPETESQTKAQGQVADALVTAITALGGGDRTPLFELLGADVRWSWTGTMSWTRTFVGRDAVIDELFGGVDATVAAQQGVQIHSVVGDGSRVVVEFIGHNTTPAGDRYDNRYCWVARFAESHLVELHEYMDTELASSVFGPTASSESK